MKRLGTPWIAHYSSGEHDLRAHHAPRFLADLAELVAEFRNCDVLLYQAGADAHVADPLGGWMTTAELAERDRWCSRPRLVMASQWHGTWRAGISATRPGGIGPVLEIHRNTMKACAGALSIHDSD